MIKIDIDLEFEKNLIEDNFEMEFQNKVYGFVCKHFNAVDELMKEALMRSLVYGFEYRICVNKKYGNVKESKYFLLDYILKKTDKKLSEEKRKEYELMLKDLEDKGV